MPSKSEKERLERKGLQREKTKSTAESKTDLWEGRRCGERVTDGASDGASDGQREKERERERERKREKEREGTRDKMMN